MNEHIFREYDIRGDAAADLTDSVVYDIGRALGTVYCRASAARVAIGRDCRLSSARLFERLSAGILSTGTSVVDLGVCHTPLVYYSIHHLQLDGGVMVTGSHNPPEQNGFKICLGTGSLHGAEITRLRDMIQARDFVDGTGTLTAADIRLAYIDELAANVTLARQLHVVIDAGNGTGGVVAKPILERLGCRVTALNCAMDGRFPIHHPDPTVPENLAQLIETVRQEGADLGIAYDGDADRIGAVDARGGIIWGDQLMVLFARDILRDNPGATIISEVKSSQNLYQDVTRHGGNAIMWKTGHSLIKAKMRETGALLAGEMSGHMFFAHRYYGYDDAIYASCRLVELVAAQPRPVHELLADLPPSVTTPEIRVPCPDASKFAVIEQVRQAFADRYEIIAIDGARILMPGGWGLVRASNTQPVLVLRFEAETQERLQQIRQEVEQEVNRLLAQVS